MPQRIRVRSLLLAVLLPCVSCERQPPMGPEANRLLPGFTASELGGPLPGLTLDQRALFERGRGAFQTEFTPLTGLGPLFNNNACSQCHEAPVVAGSGEEVETHATAFRGGTCDDLSAIGGPVIQDSMTPLLHAALPGIEKEPVPTAATAIGHRTTPSLLGFGLLEAVPDAEILGLGQLNNRSGDGISGRPNRTADGRLGRFGRKAQVATLSEFNAGAFINEMGITSPTQLAEQTIGGNPLPPGVDPAPDPELPQDVVDATTAFVQFLAPPAPLPRTPVERQGFVTFLQLRCSACHAPVLVTGPNRVQALSLKVFQPYTDLLLHDMGPELADICLGSATPAEFRTEPLMGLRFKTSFLHDGRATSLEQAIEAHGGEASNARSRFRALTPLQRFALLRFLQGL